MHNHRPFKLLAAVAILALAGGALAACKKAEDESGGGGSVVDPDGSGKQAPPEVPPLWPLTGLPGDVVERPALSVKVENPKVARPQSGLESADIVWEQMVEGGESRLVAVFHSQLPDSVGPVRSVRPMDGAIAGPTHGILACSGGAAQFIAKTADAGLQVVQENSAGFYRSTDRSMPHNLYLRPADVIAQANDSHKAPPPAEFQFAGSDATSTAAKQGTDAAMISLVLSSVSKPKWTWAASSGTFLRSEQDEPAMAASGVRLSAANVLVISVEIQNAGGTDAAGSPIPESMLVGSGTGLVASAGKSLEIDWSKESAAAPLVIKTKAGEVVQLVAGQTWVELIPRNTGTWTVS
ncbi:MAG: DUF3048 domain-containing protein [Bifidobacteriaceae bacterium]|jgi:hypothetical protein|nr:DUF3048 domain-containing protein [Bifidobacteriaceae bacterium]